MAKLLPPNQTKEDPRPQKAVTELKGAKLQRSGEFIAENGKSWREGLRTHSSTKALLSIGRELSARTVMENEIPKHYKASPPRLWARGNPVINI
jgi:hypothetical protein